MDLHVFDFDGTLFRSPDNPTFCGYWWNYAKGLEPPCVPKQPDEEHWITETLDAAREAIDDPDSITMLLTGRTAKTFHARVLDLLAQQDLAFDTIALRPNGSSKEWKLSEITDELTKHPDIDTVHVYDDREEHLEFFEAMLTDLGFKVVSHHVAEEVPVCGLSYDRRKTRNSSRRDAGHAGPTSRPVDGERTPRRGDAGIHRFRYRRLGATMGSPTADEVRNRRAAFIRLAQDPVDEGEGPTEEQLVKQVEDKPGSEWRDKYLQPIIRIIRNRFDLEKGQVALVSPTKKVPFGADNLGFEITGHVRFTDFVPSAEEFGKKPYRFTATISPDGEIIDPITIEGV